jgi:hypothetical protein
MTMTIARWERWAPVSGIVYGVLFALGLALIVWDEVDSKSDAEIASYYGDSGSRNQEELGLVLIVVGVLFLLIFTAALSDRFRAEEVGGRLVPPLVFGAGVAAAALQVGAAALLVTTSTTVDLVSDFTVDADLARVAFAAGINVLYGGLAAMLLFTLAASVGIFGSSTLPRWLGWLSLVAVVAAILEAILLPVFTMPIWVMVTSIVLMTRPEASSG